MSVKAFSILHIPPNGVEVTDGEAVSMRNTAGGDPHVGHAVVENGAITGINLEDATTCFVDDGDAVNVVGTDGHSVRGAVTAAVASSALLLELPAGSTIITDQADAINVKDVGGSTASSTAVITGGTNQLSYVSLSGNGALAVNGATVKMNNSDGSGLIDGTAVVTGGILVSVNLSESTKTIVANSFSTGITGYPAQSFATLNVSASGLQSVTVTAPNAALVVNNSALVVPVTGTYTTTITPQVNASGVITGFTLS